jgi:pimeloyl-ACP methyl ester carboxylesterase
VRDAECVTDVRVQWGGQGNPVTLLLHGLGATSEVWNGLVPLLPGAWVAPDLPGHGRSDPLPAYTFPAVADAVADLVDPAGTVILGHSFGGVVGLHLAACLGVGAVVGLGIKVAWAPDELARSAALAAREPARFSTRAEAIARHLRISGLDGLVRPDAPAAEAGVVEEDGQWRPALDPRVFGVGDPQVRVLLYATPVPVLLARGEHDAMVSAEQLRALAPDSAVDLPGLGHNAHVEDPAAVAELLARLR